MLIMMPLTTLAGWIDSSESEARYAKSTIAIVSAAEARAMIMNGLKSTGFLWTKRSRPSASDKSSAAAVRTAASSQVR